MTKSRQPVQKILNKSPIHIQIEHTLCLPHEGRDNRMKGATVSIKEHISLSKKVKKENKSEGVKWSPASGGTMSSPRKWHHSLLWDPVTVYTSPSSHMAYTQQSSAFSTQQEVFPSSMQLCFKAPTTITSLKTT